MKSAWPLTWRTQYVPPFTSASISRLELEYRTSCRFWSDVPGM